MASQLSELQKSLKRHGWKLLKEGTKHSIYEKDGQTMLIPHGTKIYSRSYKQMLMKIRGKSDRSKLLTNPRIASESYRTQA